MVPAPHGVARILPENQLFRRYPGLKARLVSNVNTSVANYRGMQIGYSASLKKKRFSKRASANEANLYYIFSLN